MSWVPRGKAPRYSQGLPLALEDQACVLFLEEGAGRGPVPSLELTYLPLLTSQAAQASTGALTAERPALAIHVASASRPPVCAGASPTTGADSVSSPAPAAPTDSATKRQAYVTAILVGGHPRVVAHASATQQHAVTRPLEPACAHLDGGAAAAASSAAVTTRPVCRTLATVPACRAGGVLSVITGASVFEASAVLLLAIVPALLASMEPAVSCPATLATMEYSAEKGKGHREAAGGRGGGKK